MSISIILNTYSYLGSNIQLANAKGWRASRSRSDRDALVNMLLDLKGTLLGHTLVWTRGSDDDALATRPENVMVD